jgi:hypothetical protein
VGHDPHRLNSTEAVHRAAEVRVSLMVVGMPLEAECVAQTLMASTILMLLSMGSTTLMWKAKVSLPGMG